MIKSPEKIGVVDEHKQMQDFDPEDKGSGLVLNWK